MSVSEKFLWERLRKDQTGFRWRRQMPFGPYVLDFYCPTAQVAIEVDGEQHTLHSQRDAVRDAYFLELNIETFRFPTLDLFEYDSLKGERFLKGVLARCRQRQTELSRQVKLGPLSHRPPATET